MGFAFIGVMAEESNNSHIQELYSNTSIYIYVYASITSLISYQLGIKLYKRTHSQNLYKVATKNNLNFSYKYSDIFTKFTIFHLFIWKLYFFKNNITYVLFDEYGSFYYSIITLNITLYYSILVVDRLEHLKSKPLNHVFVCCTIAALGMRIHIIPIIFLLLLTLKSVKKYHLLFLFVAFSILLLIGSTRFGESDFSIITLFGEFAFPHTMNSIFINSPNDLASVMESGLVCDLQSTFLPQLPIYDRCIGIQNNTDFILEFSPVGGFFLYPLTYLYLDYFYCFILMLIFFIYGYLAFKIFSIKSARRFELAIFISFSLALNRMGLLFTFKYIIIIFIYATIQLYVLKGLKQCFYKRV